MRNRGEFTADTSYRVGDRATFRGQIFECIKHVSKSPVRYSPDDPARWEHIGPDMLQLSQWIGGQFSLRFQSTGDAANRAASRILLETVGATRENPYLLQFQQIILDPFTGPGEFYLDERDASDVPGGESTITVATKDGFSAGYNAGITVAITVDKIYHIAFIPGTTGDGIYLINISSLQRGNLPLGVFPPAPAIHPPLT